MASIGNPFVAVLMGPVKWTPISFRNARAVSREANHESAYTLRQGRSITTKFSLRPILSINRTVQAVVACFVLFAPFLASHSDLALLQLNVHAHAKITFTNTFKF